MSKNGNGRAAGISIMPHTFSDVVRFLRKQKWENCSAEKIFSDLDKLFSFNENTLCEVCGQEKAFLYVLFSQVLFLCQNCYEEKFAFGAHVLGDEESDLFVDSPASFWD